MTIIGLPLAVLFLFGSLWGWVYSCECRTPEGRVMWWILTVVLVVTMVVFPL